MSLRERIKEVRIRAGVTQKELAERLGVYQKDVSRWESGVRPTVDMLKRICEELNVSADVLLELKDAK